MSYQTSSVGNSPVTSEYTIKPNSQKRKPLHEDVKAMNKAIEALKENDNVGKKSLRDNIATVVIPLVFNSPDKDEKTPAHIAEKVSARLFTGVESSDNRKEALIGLIHRLNFEEILNESTCENKPEEEKIPTVVDVKFNENTFEKLSEELKAIIEKKATQSKEITEKISEVAGLTAASKVNTLDKSLDRSSCKTNFNAYPTFFNNAVELLSKLTDQEKAFEKHRLDAKNAFEKFKEKNTQWIAHIENLYLNLAQEATLLEQHLSGRVTFTTRIMGTSGTATIKIATPTSKERYVAAEISLEAEKNYDMENFTTLFRDIHRYYVNITAFVKKTRKSMDKLSGPRKWLTKDSPNYDNDKLSLSRRMDTYKILHDQALDIFKTLNIYNSYLDIVNNELQKRFDDQLNELSQSKKGLISIMEHLLNGYRDLDRAISLTTFPQHTKDMKKLTATTTEKDKYEAYLLKQ